MTATISETTGERATEAQAENTGTIETPVSTEAPVSTDVSQETADVATGAQDPAYPEIAFDINSFPEEQREAAKQAYDKINADFKRAYTPKFQDLKSRETVRDQEVQQLNQKLQEWGKIAQEVMQDPSKLEAYRRIYFPEAASTTAEQPKEYATVEELVTDYESKLKHTQQVTLEQARREAAEQVAKSNREMQWDTAMNVVRQDPIFVRYEREISANIQSDKRYKTMFTGANQVQVLQAGLEDFKEKLRLDMDRVKQEAVKSNVQKKAAATVVPRKATTTSSNVKAGASKEEVLSRINRRLQKES